MSIRQEKISRAIQRDLAPLLSKFCSGILPGQLVTIVDVVATADLGLAKIYIGILAAKDKEKSLEKIQQSSREIRHELAQTFGKKMRKVPELHFYLDDTMDHAERINSLLNNLD